MARILTTPASSGAAAASTGLLDRYTPKFPVGSVTVPPGASACFITGVAAGGRASSLTGTNSPIDTIAASPSGNIIIGTGGSGTPSNPIHYDPVGRKQVPICGTAGTLLAAGATGANLLVLDNGFIFSSGGSGRYWTTNLANYGDVWTNINIVMAGGPLCIAAAPSLIDDPVTNIRIVFITNGAPTANSLAVWAGTGFYQGLVSYTNSATLSRIDNVNGFFVLSATGGTNKTCLYFKSNYDATDPNNWPVSVVDAVNNRGPAGLAFGNGIYVYACTDGSLYTATSLTGPWTARTSGVGSIGGIKFAGGRFVCVGSHVSTQSADGITWTSGSLTGLTWGGSQPAVTYCTRIAKWCALVTNQIYTSVNGSTWVAQNAPNGLSVTAILDTPSGLFFATGATGYITPDPTTGHALQFSSSNDGGSLRVTRVSDNTELLSLAGGLSNGIGGSSITQPGIDYYGTNAVAPGTISSAEARPPTLPHLGSPATYGLKVAGGAGRANTSQGGASLFAPPTNFLLSTSATPAKPVGPGAGGANSTVASMGAGGGEGVIRHKISVTPGEVLAFSSGLAISNPNLSSAANLAFEPSRGYISFEFA
jgi:hypothetical protein